MAKKKTKKKAVQVGSNWRLRATGNRGVTADLHVDDSDGKFLFDEVVVDEWFHIERMDHDAWWMRIGEANLWVQIDPKTQKVRVNTYDGIITPRGFIAEERPDSDEKKARA